MLCAALLLRGAAGAPAAPQGKGGASVADLVQRGNAARREGQIEAALAAYREARGLAPERVEVRLLLADTLRRVGRLDEAEVEYAAAASLDPRRAEAVTGLAMVRRARFDFEGAIAILEPALGRVPADRRADLLLTLAETRRRQGRPDEAERLLREVLRARPGEPPALAGLAQVAEARGDLGGAVGFWTGYLEARPDDEPAQLRRQELRELKASIGALREAALGKAGGAVFSELGRLLAVSGDPAGATGAWKSALAADPESADARRGLALALRDLGDRRGAASQFRRLLRQTPRDGVALYNLVGLARSAGDREAERDAWRALIEARPDDLFAVRAWLAALEDEGGEALKQAIAGERGDGDPGVDRPGASTALLRRRALLEAAAGQTTDATDDLYEALRRDPTDPWTQQIAIEILALRPALLQDLGTRAVPTGGHPPAADDLVLLARLTWWSGRGGDALLLLRRAVAIDPQSARARSALAEAYQVVGRNEALALGELQRAAELVPGSSAAQVDLALAHLRSGRAGEAETAARRALALDGSSAPALSVLGAALMDGGDPDDAAAAYAAALRIDPADNFGLARIQYPLILAALGRQVEARHALAGEIPPIPEAIYREAWSFTRDSFRDKSYAGQDWSAWNNRYRGRLRTVADAHRAIATMLGALGDPYTRLRDAEETGALYLSRRGEGVAVDPLGRNRSQSQSVIVKDLPGGLGYIRLSNLSDPRVVEEVRRALRSMREKEGLILDLRGNPGGFARSADAIGDLLTGPGREAGVDAGPEGIATRITGGDGAQNDSPLTVLVDGQTASAAERLARTLESTGRGRLAGARTRGKGLAQVSRVLPGGATVLVSAAEMLGADGSPLQGHGLQPGAPVPPEAAASPGAPASPVAPGPQAP